MGTAVGLNTVVGTAEESTYGTAVTVNRWTEILSESLDRQNTILQSNGMRPGTRNLRRGSRRALSARMGSGDVVMEVATTGMGRWFKHILGGTPTVVQQASTDAYLHTYAMGSLTGKSLTVQKSLRDGANAEVESFTFKGCKVTSAEFSISVDQILQLTVSLDARDVVTDIAYATPSYTDVSLFNFSQASLNVDGSPVALVTDASVSIENALKTDSFYLGSGGLKAQPADNDFPSVTGSLTAEFDSPTVFYDRFAADTGAELVLEFVGANIEDTYDETLTITVPDVRFTGEVPKVGGPDIVTASVPFEAVADGSSAGITITALTTDTAV